MRKPLTPYKVKIPLDYWPAITKGMNEAGTSVIDRNYDIPYVAGYPKDVNENKVYWDRHFPMFFNYKGRKIFLRLPIATHERVEKNLIYYCGLKYLPAHRIATDMEAKVVKAMRVPWDVYDKFCQSYIKTIGSEKIRKVPSDLDLEPYYDEHDESEIRKIMEAMK